jgi:hypothetical protein
MKTFLKLIIAFAAFGFATANADYTPGQTAAIQAVTDAVASGDEEEVKAVISQKVAEFPEIAAEIVMAAISVQGVSSSLQAIIVQTAAFTAPGQVSLIVQALKASSNNTIATSLLIALANVSAQAALQAQSQQTPFNNNPPPPVS